MKKPDSVDQMWKLFVIRVDLRGAPKRQLFELELAFKAGCAAVLMELLGPVAEIPDEAGVMTIQRWRQEIGDFLTKRVREYGGSHDAH